MQDLNSGIKAGFIPFIYHSNAPSCDIANVLKETPKAINLSIEGINKSFWLPKSALYFTPSKVWSVKPWFKRKATADILHAVGISI